MTPQPSQIAHYRITSKLGEGGMGAVYRATDTKLNREVAIKVLPEAFAVDPDRMARFTREAQVLASLNHPNIAAVYGIEQGAIVMELVEGADLKGPVPVQTAIDYARRIASALEAAHEKGVVHRDLKPANIKVTPEGVVKLLDFGLAKATEAAPVSNSTQSPTLSLAMTQAGMILGTAAYMSPEQARGKPVDKRADIWAFGVVFFEMLAGTALFAEGETVTDIIAAVVTRDPEWSALPKATPANVRRLLERCLRKDPKLRLRDIGEARIALDEPPEPMAFVAAAPSTSRLRWLAVGLVAAVLALALGWWRAARPVERPLLNFNVDLGVAAIPALRSSFAISRDGSRIVYLHANPPSGALLEVRELGRAQGTVLAGTAGAEGPFFSPDGQWIGFFANAKLQKVPVAGGAAIPLWDAPNGRGADWASDGRIVFVPERSSGLFIINESGGAPQPLEKFEAGESSHRWPQWLPGEDAVLFTANTTPTDWENGTIVAYSLKTRQRKVLVRGGYFGRFLPGGYLTYERGGKLYALRFNVDRLETSGAPVVLLEDVAGSQSSGAGQLGFSTNGLFAYLAGQERLTAYTFGWMAEGGAVEAVRGAPVRNYWFPHLSPDGKRLALTDPAGNLTIWDFEREMMTPLPVSGLRPMAITWAPDGRHLAYGDSFEAFGIWWRRADGSGEPFKLLDGDGALLPISMSPDGSLLAFTKGSPDHSSMWLLPIRMDDPDRPKAGAPIEFLRQSAAAQYPVISPDGRWIAYGSLETGRFEVFVRPLHGSGKWQVSAGGGSRPKWSHDGRRLFYATEESRVMVVDCSATGDAFTHGKARLWSETPISSAGGPPNFDVAPDGQRILAFPPEFELAKGNLHLTFLLNFFDEVKRRLP